MLWLIIDQNVVYSGARALVKKEEMPENWTIKTNNYYIHFYKLQFSMTGKMLK